MNICLDCKMSCCKHCNYYQNKICAIYNTRPEKCKLFPYYYNIYKDNVESIKTCPQWKYFDKLLNDEIRDRVKYLTLICLQ